MRKNLLMVLKALLEDAKRSDRDIAKGIGISQPTVTRARRYLRKQGFIVGYPAILDFSKVGFEIVAITIRDLPFTWENWQIMIKDQRVIFATKEFAVSVHKNYADYAEIADKFPCESRYLTVTSEKPLKPLSLSQLL